MGFEVSPHQMLPTPTQPSWEQRYRSSHGLNRKGQLDRSVHISASSPNLTTGIHPVQSQSDCELQEWQLVLLSLKLDTDLHKPHRDLMPPRFPQETRMKAQPALVFPVHRDEPR